MLTGHCFCGAVRYEAGGMPSQETNCHCSMCRRISGAPFVAWFTVPAIDFRIVAGKPARFRSSDHGTRTFCAGCGTPLTFQSARRPAEIDITTCSLDDPERLPPRDHIHNGSRLRWVQLADKLPLYDGTRPG